MSFFLSIFISFFLSVQFPFYYIDNFFHTIDLIIFFLFPQFFQILPYLLTHASCTSSCSLSLPQKKKKKKKTQQTIPTTKKAHTKKIWNPFCVSQLLLNMRPSLEWLLYPVPLQWRKRIFSLPAASNCK